MKIQEKKTKHYAKHLPANMKQVVSLEMESIQRSHESLPSTLSTALFHGRELLFFLNEHYDGAN